MGTCRSICCTDLKTVELLFVGAVTQICVTLWGHGRFLALWERAGEFIALVMKQLFIAAVTQMCATLWGHGHLLALWVGQLSYQS